LVQNKGGDYASGRVDTIDRMAGTGIDFTFLTATIGAVTGTVALLINADKHWREVRARRGAEWQMDPVWESLRDMGRWRYRLHVVHGEAFDVHAQLRWPAGSSAWQSERVMSATSETAFTFIDPIGVDPKECWVVVDYSEEFDRKTDWSAWFALHRDGAASDERRRQGSRTAVQRTWARWRRPLEPPYVGPGGVFAKRYGWRERMRSREAMRERGVRRWPS